MKMMKMVNFFLVAESSRSSKAENKEVVKAGLVNWWWPGRTLLQAPRPLYYL